MLNTYELKENRIKSTGFSNLEMIIIFGSRTVKWNENRSQFNEFTGN